MSNEEIITAMRKHPETQQAYMLDLWTQNAGIITQTARRFCKRTEFDDAMQEAYLGLVEAVEHYEPERGAKFTTCAAYWIEQRLNRHEKKSRLVHLPEHLSGLAKKVQAFRESFRAWYSREPTPKEIARGTGCTQQTIVAIMSGATSDTLSLDQTTEGEDGESQTIGDTLQADADTEADVVDREYNAQRARDVWETVATLPEEQADTIRARYLDGLTIPEIARRRGEKLSATRTAESRAMRALKNGDRRRKLLPYLDDIRSSAMQGTGAIRYAQTWTSATERTALQELERNYRF